MEYGGDVLGAFKRTHADDRWQSTLDVDFVGFCGPECSHERSVGFAPLHLGEAPRAQARATQECLPSLLLGDSEDGLVLGGEHHRVIRLALSALQGLMGRQLSSFLRQHLAQHVSGRTLTGQARFWRAAMP